MRTTCLCIAFPALLLGVEGDKDKSESDSRPYTQTFLVDEKDFSSSGKNPFFSLEPGYVLVLETAGAPREALTITVLAETKKVAGIETRVVEERETVDGKEKEVSRNFFAICKRTNSVYYFGEDAGGAWLHGEKGAHFGMIMPGTPLLGARYQQEIAPGVSMDRAEILSLSETVETPAGKFTNCLKVLETNPVEPGAKEYKYYAPGVGLVQEESLRLVKYGDKSKL